jgi:hypothetical protein
MPFEEPIDKTVDLKITLKPCYSANPTAWNTIAA